VLYHLPTHNGSLRKAT